MFNSLKALLPKAIASHGLSTRVHAVTLHERFTTLVAERWGAEAARLVRPARLERGVLLVEVQSSALAQELMLQATSLVGQLSQDIHLPRVVRIRTILR